MATMSTTVRISRQAARGNWRAATMVGVVVSAIAVAVAVVVGTAVPTLALVVPTVVVGFLASWVATAPHESLAGPIPGWQPRDGAG